jgi:hypothetical protein
LAAASAGEASLAILVASGDSDTTTTPFPQWSESTAMSRVEKARSGRMAISQRWVIRSERRHRPRCGPSFRRARLSVSAVRVARGGITKGRRADRAFGAEQHDRAERESERDATRHATMRRLENASSRRRWVG